MTRTGFIYHPDCVEHDTGPGHPERGARLTSIRDGLAKGGILDDVDVVEPAAIDPVQLFPVHEELHVQSVEQACRRAPAAIDGDTVVSAGTWRAALLSAGGVLDAVQRVQSRAWRNAFVCCRPPGHHAEKFGAMGFCLFNNVAIAAQALRTEYGLERVAILDWDVHHGNGTQHIFEADPSVFYASLHQFPHYPGTGAASERGTGSGHGATLNCPLEAGTGDSEWLARLDQDVLPALEDFRPEFLLVSAGFDAHRLDPLSGTRVTAAGFGEMTQRVLELAQRVCDGRLVSVLEGGYHLDALASSAGVHLETLRG